MKLLPLLHVLKRLLLYLAVGLTLLTTACNIFYEPGPPKTPVPIPVDLESLLIEVEALPQLASSREWQSTIGVEWQDWSYARPVAVATVGFSDGKPEGAFARQAILQMQDATEAGRLWANIKNDAVDFDLLEYYEGRVSLVSVNELPPIHADQVHLLCDNYGARLGVMCSARLQYKMFVMFIDADIDGGTVTPKMFYEIVGVADEAMRPIWENWPVPAVTSPVATPTITPTAQTVMPSSTVPVLRWQSIPLGPPGSNQSWELEGVVGVESSLALEETMKFYISTLQDEGWILFEQLSSPINKVGGPAFFLHFWRLTAEGEFTSETVCIYGLSEDNTALSVFVSAGDCVDVRATAERTKMQPWQIPYPVEWESWRDERLAIAYPAEWQEDPELFEQPFCQPQGDIECVTSFIQEEQDGVARLSVTVKARSSDKSLIDLAVEQRQADMEVDPALLPGLLLQIQLDDGGTAIQDITLRRVGDTTGILFKVHSITDTQHFIVTGSVFGEREQMLTNYTILAAIARSLNIAGN